MLTPAVGLHLAADDLSWSKRVLSPAEYGARCRCRLKAVKKVHSGLVTIGRRSLNAHAAVLVAKKKMGRFVIRRSDISGLGVFTLGATLHHPQ